MKQTEVNTEKIEPGCLAETLYDAKRAQASIRILSDIDTNTIASYGYCELLQLAYLYSEKLESLYIDMSGIVHGLEAVGVDDSDLYPKETTARG